MRDGKRVQMPHSCYHVETILHPNSSYITTKLYGTCGCNTHFSFNTWPYRRNRFCLRNVDIGSMSASLQMSSFVTWSFVVLHLATLAFLFQRCAVLLLYLLLKCPAFRPVCDCSFYYGFVDVIFDLHMDQ